MAIKTKTAQALAGAIGHKQNTIDHIVTYPEELEQDFIMGVEKELGYETLDFFIEKAYKYAKHKLEWQNKRYNTNHSLKYLEKLTAEVYEQQAFSQYTILLSRGFINETNN